MATPVFDATSSNAITAGTSKAWNHTVGAGLSRTILLVSVHAQTANISSISGTWNGTEAITFPAAWNADAGTYGQVVAGYVLNPTAGTHEISISWTGSTSFFAGADSFSNVNQSTPTRTADTDVSTDSLSNNLSFDCTADDVAVGFFFVGNTQSVSGGAGQTARWSQVWATNNAAARTDTKVGAAPTQTMSWSWSDIGVHYNAAVGFALIGDSSITLTPSPATAVAASVAPTFKHYFTPGVASAVADSVAPTWKYAVTPSPASAVAASAGGTFLTLIILNAPYRSFGLTAPEVSMTLHAPYRTFRLTAPEED